jgi:hypothetical protein
LGLPRFWLLVPADPDLIDFPSTFEVELEDLDAHDDREPEDDAEPDSDAEPEADGGKGAGPVYTPERHARYRARRDAASANQPFRPLIVVHGQQETPHEAHDYQAQWP